MRLWLRRLGSWFALRRVDDDLAEELALHRELKEEEFRREGMSPREAALRARRELGNTLLARDAARAVWIPEWLSAVVRDARFGVRVLRRSPLFFATATITLALAIGANTAVFTLVDRLLVRPLPYPDGDRLATVVRHYQRGGLQGEGTNQNGATWLALSAGVTALDLAVAGSVSGVNTILNGASAYVQQQRVSAGYFRVLGITPPVGREFHDDEDRAGGPAVAILSDALARRAFGDSAAAFNRTIVVKGEPHLVVGVMPAAFWSNAPADLWTPLQPSTRGEGSGQNYLVIGRLRPGVTWVEADAQVAAVGSHIVRDVIRPPADVELTMRLAPLQRVSTARVRQQVLLLWSAAGLLLLLGCVNIAGLMLARAATRTSELATRVAIGGGRRAILRQMLVESLLVAICGGAAGIAVGFGTARIVAARLQTIIALPLRPDVRILVLSVAASLCTGVLFGLLPALQATRTDPRAAHDTGSATVTPLTRRWTSRIVVVAQIALSLVLVIGAGLLLRTLDTLTSAQPGFDSTGVVTGRVSLQDARYQTSAAVNALFARTIERLRQSPQVQDAAVALTLPYERAMNEGWRKAGEARAQQEALNYTYVTPGYFSALKVPLVRGRLLNERDAADSPRVIVVNSAFVRRYARDDDAIGSQIQFGAAGSPVAEIVGVVGDIQQRVTSSGFSDGPVAALPAAYAPAMQMTDGGFRLAHTWFEPNWIVRATGGTASTAAILREALLTVDPQLPFSAIETLDDVRERAFAENRLAVMLIGALAAVALGMCAVAIYGVMTRSVSARIRELAIRSALGAGLGTVIGTAVAPGLVLAAAGIGVGLLFARLTSGILRQVVFGVSPFDPLTFAAAAVVVAATTCLACAIPTLRVRRLDLSRILKTG
jgi:predicted permease